MNYQWTRDQHERPKLVMRAQTEEERIRLTQILNGELTKVSDDVWELTAGADARLDATVKSDYSGMSEEDLQTEIAERGLSLPKKQGGKYRKGDLVAVLVEAESK